MTKTNIGIIGVGHLGKLHLTNLLDIPDVHVSGIYDVDNNRLDKISSQYNVQKTNSIEKLLDISDAVSIVTPTSTHFEVAKEALLRKKHVFIEKPVTTSVEEAKELIELGKKENLIIQVGHIERFNPAFKAINEYDLAPGFIEAHRLASFNPRGTDVAVILDLMIHDIDLVLTLIKSPVEKIDASGVGVISGHPDIANARIQFENGAVANLTASRISQKKMRKMRIFQRNTYITADFLEKSAEIYQLKDEDSSPAAGFLIDTLELEGKRKRITYAKPPIQQDNALLAELSSFKDSINTGNPPAVSAEDGTAALKVANYIVNIINKRNGV